jgi:hypothetical protein
MTSSIWDDLKALDEGLEGAVDFSELDEMLGVGNGKKKAA